MSNPLSYHRLAINALLLKEPAYVEMRDGKSPFVQGMLLVAVVGVVIALAFSLS